MALSSIASASELTFNPVIPEGFKVTMETLDYKEIRAREICAMAKEYGLGDSCPLLIAHLYSECGAMTEDCGWKKGSASNDHGFAIGLAQWHLCYREADWMKENKLKCSPKYAATIRDKFFQDHPEMTDYRGQARRYLAEMSGCVNDGHKLKWCIDRWNAHPEYMSRVLSKVATANKLLGL